MLSVYKNKKFMNKFYKFENEVLNFMFLLKFLEMCFIFLNKELYLRFCLLCIYGIKGYYF